MKRFAAVLCMCFAVSASAKLGETVPELVKRFGKSYTIDEIELGKEYKFRSANVSVDVLVANGRSISETYFSDHPLSANGEPPNDIVRAVLRTNVPNARWHEIEAAQYAADYALQSSDGKYIAILSYTGPQPENMIWTMTVGLAKSVHAASTAIPSSNPSRSPSATPSPSGSAAQTKSADEWREFEEVPADEAARLQHERDSPASEFETGLNYYNGAGVKKNLMEAVKWFRKAAEQNYVPAQAYLASCYMFGQGVSKNNEAAVKWLRKAAEQNDAWAQCNLGVSYRDGLGVAKNSVEAVQWFRKAAAQNDSSAQDNLGSCYYEGQGVPKDYVEAAKWFRKAADQDNVLGQGHLGFCYAQGNGVPKDDVQAYKWWLLAAAKGNDIARHNITVTEGRMSRYEIAQGQKLAREFKPREALPAGGDSSGAAVAQTHPTSSGSGFFITEDGYLITNEHVAGNAARVRLVTASGVISAKVVNADAANDLALLKAQGKFAALPVAASRAMKLGSTVVTVGFPNIGLQGFAPKFARGEIASLSGPQDDPRFFQISVPLQPGNSGGALVDEHGNVIGVVSAKLSAAATLNATGQLPENVNYAVKSSFLLSFLESVPDVAAKLKEPNTRDIKFDDVVEQAKVAAVLVLVY